MSYISSYRKYRPKTFDLIIGQDHIVTTLKNQIKSNSISHAYIFNGTRGVGKTSTAKIFAKAINCLSPVDGSPCNECEVCKQLSKANDIDIIEIDAASNNRVDEIRDLREKVKYPPVNAKYKVYIIDEVHMLTDSAFNALLKTLEEPPEYVVFILATTEIHKLPATILSRCLRLDFKEVVEEDLFNHLKYICKNENLKYDENALHLIARAGEGSVRDMLSVFDMAVGYADGNLSYENVSKALGYFEKDLMSNFFKDLISNNAKILETIRLIATKGKNFTVFSRECVRFCRDIYIVKNLDYTKFLNLPEKDIADLKDLSSKLKNDEIINIMQKFASLENELRYAVDSELTFSVATLSCMKSLNSSTQVLYAETVKASAPIVEEKPLILKKTEKTEVLKEEPQTDNTLEAKKTFGKLLISLRENHFAVLSSMCEEVLGVNIIRNNFIITFGNENVYNNFTSPNNMAILKDVFKTLNTGYDLEVKLKETNNNNEEFKLDLKKLFGNKLIIK